MAAVPLTAARAGSIRVVNRDKRPLAAVAVFKGGLAAVNSAGFFRPATGTVGEIVVGTFYESVDNSAGSAGDKFADIQYPYERTIRLLDNDTVAPVVVANRERLCSVLDDHTVQLSTPAAADAGYVYDVTTEGVWVEIDGFAGGAGASGIPTLQAGTTTLVAGTKTVSGVTLTSTSRILLTMKDPGAGAITGFGAFDAPVASRNTGAGTFVINAIDDAKATITTAVCTVDYLIIG